MKLRLPSSTVGDHKPSLELLADLSTPADSSFEINLRGPQ